MPTRITSKGQVTIPIDVRQSAQVGAGTALEWSHDPVGHRIIAMQATARARKQRSRFTVMRGAASTSMSTDEIMALARSPLPIACRRDSAQPSTCLRTRPPPQS
jgi:antitoxin PrlF